MNFILKKIIFANLIFSCTQPVYPWNFTVIKTSLSNSWSKLTETIDANKKATLIGAGAVAATLQFGFIWWQKANNGQSDKKHTVAGSSNTKVEISCPSTPTHHEWVKIESGNIDRETAIAPNQQQKPTLDGILKNFAQSAQRFPNKPLEQKPLLPKSYSPIILTLTDDLDDFIKIFPSNESNTLDCQRITDNYLNTNLHKNCTLTSDEVHKYIQEGKETVGELLQNKNINQKPFQNQEERQKYLNKVIGLTWFLYSRSDTFFDEGTFVVHDNGILHDFLLTYVKKVNPDNWQAIVAVSNNPYGYARHSTHFTESQKKGYHHYGIEIRPGDQITEQLFIPESKQQKPWLPAGKKHLLFGKIDEERTFIKPENDGLFYLDGLSAHSLGALASFGRKVGFGYLGSDDAPTYRKERLPQELSSEAKSIMKQHRIHGSIKTVSDILKITEKEPEAFAGLTKKICSLYPKDKGKGRFGNEIILTLEDLKK